MEFNSLRFVVQTTEWNAGQHIALAHLNIDLTGHIGSAAQIARSLGFCIGGPPAVLELRPWLRPLCLTQGRFPIPGAGSSMRRRTGPAARHRRAEKLTIASPR
jgi:hypothetical protein